jgi:putative NIF3 family GTP cyclohydrolase 1 type 2
VLAERLGLKDIMPLVADSGGEDGCGLGRIGSYADPLVPGEFLHRLRTACNPPWLLEAGSRPAVITRAAICGGSCSSVADAAMHAGAQVFVTAEVKHSIARWAEEAGLWLIDAGHFATEFPAMHDLADLLASETGQRFGAISVESTRRQKPPLQLVDERIAEEGH